MVKETVRMSDNDLNREDESLSVDASPQDNRKTSRMIVGNDVNLEQNVPLPGNEKLLPVRFFLTHISLFGLRTTCFQLSEGVTVVGRYDEEEPSDISITGDDTISRRSVAIVIGNSRGRLECKLKVLNATNRVLVNGKEILVSSEVFLNCGDIIKLGHSKFKFDGQ